MEMSPDSPPSISSWPSDAVPLPSDPLPFDAAEVTHTHKAPLWETLMNTAVLMFFIGLALLIVLNLVNNSLPFKTMLGGGH